MESSLQELTPYFSFLYFFSFAQWKWEVNFEYFHWIYPLHAKFYKDAEASYVYWTVHHIDSWIKRDQLDFTCFIISLFNAQHVLDVNTSILRSLWLICWVISWVVLLWFNVCWCYVAVWLWWCGIRMQASACIWIPHQVWNIFPSCINSTIINLLLEGTQKCSLHTACETFCQY